MDINKFADELLSALAELGYFKRVVIQPEGPIVSGYAYINDTFYLRYYFNEITGTTAFALIKNERRIWGVDYDNHRGWHLHPIDDPTMHINTQKLTIEEIMDLLEDVLEDMAP